MLHPSLLAYLIGQTGAPSPAATIPFRLADSAIIADAVVNGRNVSAVFDTGFSGSFALSSQLDFGEPTGKISIRDFVGQSEQNTYKIKSIKLGGVNIDPASKQIISQEGFDGSWGYGTHIDGLMGLEVLKDYVFKIDFDHKQFVLYPSSYDITKLHADNKKTFLTKMLPIGTGSIELLTKTDAGKEMILAFDTGNGFFATTHTDVLTRIGLWKDTSKAKWVGSSQIASGAVDSFNLKLDNLNIFGVPVPTSVWSIIDLPSGSSEMDGTVGFQFLKNFNTTIDLKRRAIYMENFTGVVSNDEKSSTGIVSFYDPKIRRMRVISIAKESPAEAAGIKRGDVLISVDGKEIGQLGLSSAIKLMEGPTNSVVKVQLSRGGQLKTYSLKRILMVNHVDTATPAASTKSTKID